MNRKIVLSVPSDIHYLATVESFAELLIKRYDLSEDERSIFSRRLRATLNEAFVNVIRHTPVPENALVEVEFELNESELIIRFPDWGRGLKIDGFYPPFPEELIGTDHLFLKTIDGEVHVHVESAQSLKLWFKEFNKNLTPEKLLENVSEGGMGLSIIVKTMDEASFIWDEQRGHYLEIKKNLGSLK